MAEERRKKKSNIVVWFILGLLVLALGGFGVGNFGGTLSNVAEVGDREVTVDEYARALRDTQTRLSRQTGQQLTMAQLQTFGLDRQVMEQLLARAALAYESDRIGLSVGDGEVARRIRATPAFGGVAGEFDREGYTFALRNIGLNERQYEQQVREETAREILQLAIIGGAEAPAGQVERIVGWLSETRDITLATITVDDLPGGIPAPTDADLQAFYDADPTRFQTPERREITYAWITPGILAPQIEVDDAALRDVYEERSDIYIQPRRILAEQLAFSDEAAAQAARDAIEAGETTFETLVEERGLSLEDVDVGEVAEGDYIPSLNDPLFALEEPGLVGPVDSELGPALFRVNAILDATETAFEEVRDDLAFEFADAAARRQIDAARDDIDDLLAGGAELEDLAAETDMALAQVSYDSTDRAGIAAYEEFRAAAEATEEGDFPELTALSDGGLFALRLDSITPPATPPLDEVRAEVEAAWTSDTLLQSLTEAAEAFAENPTEDISASPDTLTGLARDAPLEGTPPALLEQVFQAEPGDVFAVEGDDRAAFVVRVDAVNAADPEAEDVVALTQTVTREQRNAVAGDLFEYYGRAIQAEAGFSVDAAAVQAVQSQLLGP